MHTIELQGRIYRIIYGAREPMTKVKSSVSKEEKNQHNGAMPNSAESTGLEFLENIQYLVDLHNIINYNTYSNVLLNYDLFITKLI